MMMAGCFSPPGGAGGGSGDPWGQEFDDERFYRMSARKFNKHMAEKRRRCRINTALERLKYIILHVMRRNPEHFDKMEKADILDMTVKFLKAVQKHQTLSAPRPPVSQASHRSVSSTSSSHMRQQPRPINIYTDPEPGPSTSTSSSSASDFSSAHHLQGKERGASMGLKSRSGNIPSAVVRAVQDCPAPKPSPLPSPQLKSDEYRHDFGKGLDCRKRPAAPTATASPAKRPAQESNHYFGKKPRISSSTVSSAAAAGRPESGTDDDDGPKPIAFGHHLEYRLHSAFHLQPRDAHWPPSTLFCPVPTRPHSSTSSSSSASGGIFPIIPGVSSSMSRVGRSPGSPEPNLFSPGRAVKPSPSKSKLDTSKVDKSKTRELKIEIPVTRGEEAVPPLQPAAARGPETPPYALPLPGLLTSQVWRPW